MTAADYRAVYSYRTNARGRGSFVRKEDEVTSERSDVLRSEMFCVAAGSSIRDRSPPRPSVDSSCPRGIEKYALNIYLDVV